MIYWILYADSVNECKQQNDKIMHNNRFHFVQKGNDDLNIRWETYGTKNNLSVMYKTDIQMIKRWGLVQACEFLVAYPTN